MGREVSKTRSSFNISMFIIVKIHFMGEEMNFFFLLPWCDYRPLTKNWWDGRRQNVENLCFRPPSTKIQPLHVK